MSENKNTSNLTTEKINLESLDPNVADSVRVFAEKLLEMFGDNLKSITVVGSSLTEDYRPGRSDINTVLVLGKLNLDSLVAIASLARPMSKRKLSAPLLMTTSYIERSRDVFGVEFLDLQMTHRTIYGDDPFETLSFDKKDIRLQCERELKAMLIKLRQGYIAAAADRKLVRDILISTAKDMTPLLNAMLWLKDIERPELTQATLNKAGDEFSFDPASLARADTWRHEKVTPDQTEIRDTFETIYSVVEKLSEIVDRLEV